MNKEEKQALLKEWEAVYSTAQNIYDQGYKLLMCAPESPWASVIFTAFEKYTKVLALVVEDKDQWLEWYVWENKMGKGKLKAKAPQWRTDKNINSTEKLLELIEACNKT